MADLIIGDQTPVVPPPPDGHRGMGLILRDYKTFPLGAYPEAVPFTLPLIPRDEWQDRIDALAENKARLSDIRDIGADGEQIPALDQGQYPYCWSHSSTMACMMARATDNQPYQQLSAFAVACMIKNYANEGGWCAQSLKFIAARGVPTTAYWPQQSKDPKNDNPRTWENAALHRTTEWYDLNPHMMVEQMATCLLSGLPLAADFAWWGHSVCVLDLVSIKPPRIRILNSWGNQWGDAGTGILEGSKVIPASAVACRVMRGALA